MQEFMLFQILIGFSVLATAIPKPENEHKSRVINKVCSQFLIIRFFSKVHALKGLRSVSEKMQNKCNRFMIQL